MIPIVRHGPIDIGDNYFVAVGGSQQSGGKSVVIASSDGINWMAGNSGTTKTLNAVAYDPNSKRFIAVGQDGVILTSGNLGATWSLRNSGTTHPRSDIAWGNGCLVAVGYAVGVGGSYVCCSTDGGLTWTAVKPGVSTILGIAFRP